MKGHKTVLLVKYLTTMQFIRPFGVMHHTEFYLIQSLKCLDLQSIHDNVTIS